MPLPDSLHREMVYSRLGSATFSYGIAKDRLSGDPAFFVTATFPFARPSRSRSFQTIRDVATDEVRFSYFRNIPFKFLYFGFS